MSEKSEKGININFLNTFLTGLTAFVFCLILLISGAVNKKFDSTQESIRKFIICEQSSTAIKEGVDYLTNEARFFVCTQRTEHAFHYETEITEKMTQERAMENLRQVCSEKDLAYQRLKIALDQTRILIDMELYAMRLEYEALLRNSEKIQVPEIISQVEISGSDKELSAEELQKKAMESLFGDGYLIYRMRVIENCNITISSIEKKIEDELGANAGDLGKRLFHLQVLLCVLLAVDIVIFGALAFLVLNPLRKFARSIKNDEKLESIGSSEFKNLAAAYNEIYELKAKTTKNLLMNAEYDSLTGILNRRAFDQICQTSAEKKQKIALLLIDMDKFKDINDTFGHTIGDVVLKELAKILKNTFRTDDYVARIGGDEFAAILQDFNFEATSRLIEKINDVNEQLSKIKENIHPISISVGVAFSPFGFSKELFVRADKALYAAKRSGRHTCKIYDEKTMH